MNIAYKNASKKLKRGENIINSNYNKENVSLLIVENSNITNPQRSFTITKNTNSVYGDSNNTITEVVKRETYFTDLRNILKSNEYSMHNTCTHKESKIISMKPKANLKKPTIKPKAKKAANSMCRNSNVVYSNPHFNILNKADSILKSGYVYSKLENIGSSLPLNNSCFNTVVRENDSRNKNLELQIRKQTNSKVEANSNLNTNFENCLNIPKLSLPNKTNVELGETANFNRVTEKKGYDRKALMKEVNEMIEELRMLTSDRHFHKKFESMRENKTEEDKKAWNDEREWSRNNKEMEYFIDNINGNEECSESENCSQEIEYSNPSIFNKIKYCETENGEEDSDK